MAPIRWRIQPRRARLFQCAVLVGRIRWMHVLAVRRIIQGWPTNNDSSTWNCQRWVIELVFALSRAGLLRVRWRGVRRALRMREYWQ